MRTKRPADAECQGKSADHRTRTGYNSHPASGRHTVRHVIRLAELNVCDPTRPGGLDRAAVGQPAMMTR